jgi:hypothetical protein
LFDRLKARFHRGSSCDGCGAPACCAAGPVAAPPAKTGESLKMPKEGDTPKELPEGKDGKEGKGGGAPKDLDLTPSLGRTPEIGSPRPY